MQKELGITLQKEFEQRLDAFLPTNLDKFGKAQFFPSTIDWSRHKFDAAFLFHLTSKKALQKRESEGTGTVCWSVVFSSMLFYLNDRFFSPLKSQLNNISCFSKFNNNQMQISKTDIQLLTPTIMIAQLPMVLEDRYQDAVYDLRVEPGCEGHELRSRGRLNNQELLRIEKIDELRAFIARLQRYAVGKKDREFLDIAYSHYVDVWDFIERTLDIFKRLTGDL